MKSGSTGTGGGSKGTSSGGGGSKGPGGSKGSSGSHGSSSHGSGGFGSKGSRPKESKRSDGASGGIRSPLGGKSPNAASTPALERARGRQERAAACQDGKIQRRGAAHAAKVEARTRDRDLARGRKQAVKEARREAKEARAAEKREKKDEAAASAPDRTTLAQAAAKEARRRLKKRRKRLAPPVISKAKKPKGKGGKSKAGPKVDLTKKPKPVAGGTGPKVDLTKKPKPVSGGTGPKVSRKKKPRTPAAGRKKVRVTRGKKSGPATGPGPSARRKERRKERARREATAGPGAWVPPPRQERRSAYESMWASDPRQETVWSAESMHVPGSTARRWEPSEPAALTRGTPGLPRAAYGGTIRKEARVNAPATIDSMRSQAAAEHMTEVTLDVVLDRLADAKDKCLATYDECAVLAHRAVQLRDALRELAAELAERHNIIGRLTSRALYRLAESMDLLKSKAEAMRTRSLAAAESVETAHDEMHDAYRPVQQAAFDAGLHMPSARIHNEE
ncbi:hypothetical protein ACFXP3_10280 [Streptomyces sp. NPDC059096]|uniref:hypothetical protein n=1 Tax=Streptomyces sp. NPDC059096 TaxID=3346727 RepID=UPI0036A8AA8B